MIRTPFLFLLAALNAGVLTGCKGSNRGAYGGDSLGTPSGAGTSDTATMAPDTGMAAGSRGADTGMRSTTGTRDTGTVSKKAGGTRVSGARSDTALRAAPGTQTGPRPGHTRDTTK